MLSRPFIKHSFIFTPSNSSFSILIYDLFLIKDSRIYILFLRKIVGCRIHIDLTITAEHIFYVNKCNHTSEKL